MRHRSKRCQDELVWLLCVQYTERVGVAQSSLPALNHHHDIPLLEQSILNALLHAICQTSI